MGRRSQAVTLFARAEVKNRTGTLAASIHTTGVHHDLPFSAHFDTRAGAHYALYVHEGTLMVAPIRSNRGMVTFMTKNGPRTQRARMEVRPRPHSRYLRPTLRAQVKGQRANDFLVKGMNRAFKGEIGSTVAFLPR